MHNIKGIINVTINNKLIYENAEKASNKQSYEEENIRIKSLEVTKDSHKVKI